MWSFDAHTLLVAPPKLLRGAGAKHISAHITAESHDQMCLLDRNE